MVRPVTNINLDLVDPLFGLVIDPAILTQNPISLGLTSMAMFCLKNTMRVWGGVVGN